MQLLQVEMMMKWNDKGRVPVNILYLNTLRKQDDKITFIADTATQVYNFMLRNPSEDIQLIFVLDELAGKGIVRVYDSAFKLLGELPISGLKSVRGLSGVSIIIADAPINNDLLYFAMDNGAQVLVGTKLETRKRSRVKIFTKRTL